MTAIFDVNQCAIRKPLEKCEEGFLDHLQVGVCVNKRAGGGRRVAWMTWSCRAVSHAEATSHPRVSSRSVLRARSATAWASDAVAYCAHAASYTPRSSGVALEVARAARIASRIRSRPSP